MKSITIEAKERILSKNRKKSLKELRLSKQVPGIIYNDKTNVPFSISGKDFKKIISDVYQIEIILGSQNYKAILKEDQRTPVEDYPIHLDLYALDPNKKVQVILPIRSSGKCPGVMKGGNFFMPQRKIKIKGLPHHIPDEINIDGHISGLEIGDRLLVKDLKIEGCEILHPDTMVLASVNPSRESLKQDQKEAKETKKK